MRLKRAGAKHQHGDPNSPKHKHGVCPEDHCPIHPMAGHTWGLMQAAKKISATNKVHKKKEKGQEANVSNIALATEHIINNDNKMMTEVCCIEQLDANVMETTAVD
jgi:hypothetical protein